MAREAGVSKSLVSLAVRGDHGVSADSRARILEVAARLGYRSNTWARSLARGRSQLIGVLLNDLHSGYHTDIVHGIEDAAAERGLGVVLSHGRRDGELLARRLEALCELGADGMIVVSGQIGTDALTRTAAERPVVVVGRPEDVPAVVAQVSNDDRLGARLAVQHLAALGHRRIAHLRASTRRASADRADSYEQTMRELGLDDAVHTFAIADLPTFISEVAAGGAGAATAVFAANDRLAAAVVGAAIDAGLRVPEQLSVVGYDNTDLARALRPALTSVDQPRLELGQRAMELLAERLASAAASDPASATTDTAPRVVIAPELVVRRSTAPLRAWTSADPG